MFSRVFISLALNQPDLALMAFFSVVSKSSVKVGGSSPPLVVLHLKSILPFPLPYTKFVVAFFLCHKPSSLMQMTQNWLSCFPYVNSLLHRSFLLCSDTKNVESMFRISSSKSPKWSCY